MSDYSKRFSRKCTGVLKNQHSAVVGLKIPNHRKQNFPSPGSSR